MKLAWLVLRIFGGSLFMGWILSVLALWLQASLGSGFMAIFLLWCGIGALKWYYVVNASSSSFAYLANLSNHRKQLWLIIGGFELLPWLFVISTKIIVAWV